MPRKLPFDAFGSLYQLVEGMVPGGEELVLGVQGKRSLIVWNPWVIAGRGHLGAFCFCE